MDLCKKKNAQVTVQRKMWERPIKKQLIARRQRRYDAMMWAGW